MLKSLEGSLDVALHGDISIALVVVPVKVHPTVEVADPIDSGCVVGLDGFDEIVGVGFIEVLDAEVVDAESEGGRAGDMSPEAGGVLHWFIAKRF